MAVKPLVSIYSVYQSKWIKIGGASPDIPCPSDYSGLSSTLVDSARNTSGEVIANVIKSDVAKIELTWNYMSVSDFSKLAKLFEPKYNGAFMVACCFFDEVAGTWEGDETTAPNTTTNVCRLFYPNDRQGIVAHITLDKTTGSPIGYEGVSLHLIDTGRKYGF